MLAPQTSFIDSLPRRVFSFLPLPRAFKNVIRKLHKKSQKLDKSAFTEPGSLNNQQQREKAVMQLISDFSPAAIVETGTYLGAGTKFFLSCSQDCPIFSCEIDKEYYAFSQERFKSEPRISLFYGNSIDFLRQLDQKRIPKDGPVVFYLDAHWDDHLPLAAEIDIIFSHWPQALVIIDDFAVPNDRGYHYDDYGDHNRLDAAYLNRVRGDLLIFYPKALSSQETGARRGCCYVCLPSALARTVLAQRPDYFITY